MPSRVQYGIKTPASNIVLHSESGLLLLKRRKPPYVGMYTPVGGKLDPHETPHAAAVRELHEETGLRVESLRFAGLMTETSPVAYNWILYIYAAQVVAFAPPPCDEGELRWVPYDDIPTVPTPETDRFIYAQIARGQPFVFNAEFDADITLLRLDDELTGTRLYEA